MKKSGLMTIMLLSTILLCFSCYNGETILDIMVTLVNNDTQDTHLWVGSGTCSQDNKVKPGEQRTEKYTLTFFHTLYGDSLTDSNIEISAGRSGTTLHTQKKVINPGVLNRTFQWNGSSFD